MRLRIGMVAAAVIGIAFAGGRAAVAGDPPAAAQRVSVIVKGHASATADSLEVEFTVAGNADESADAEKRYRDKRSHVLEALGAPAAAPKASGKAPEEKPRPKKKKSDEDDDDEDAAPKKAKGDAPGETPSKTETPSKGEKPDDSSTDAGAAIPVAISERALAIGVKPKDKGDESLLGKIIINGMGQKPKAEPAPMQVGSLVVATLHGLRALDREAVCRRVAGLIDKGIEAGADGSDGTPPVVHFLLDDPEALRQLAYKDAMARARARAQTLAELGDRKLGRVVSIHEIPGAASEGPNVAPAATAAIVEGIFGAKAGATAPRSFPEFTAEVEVQVDFELQP